MYNVNMMASDLLIVTEKINNVWTINAVKLRSVYDIKLNCNVINLLNTVADEEILRMQCYKLSTLAFWLFSSKYKASIKMNEY